jgi:hypothetical protein
LFPFIRKIAKTDCRDGAKGKTVALTNSTLEKMLDRFGEVALNRFTKELDLYGGNYKAFTEQEAQYILAKAAGPEALNALRDRILAKRTQGSGRVLREGVHGKTALNHSPSYIDPSEVSKAVDENGEPRLLFHGGYEKASDFSRGSLRGYLNIYFTDQYDVARKYSLLGGIDEDLDMEDYEYESSKLDRTPHITSAFVDIKNPLDADRLSWDEVIEVMGRGQIEKFINTEADKKIFKL